MNTTHLSHPVLHPPDLYLVSTFRRVKPQREEAKKVYMQVQLAVYKQNGRIRCCISTYGMFDNQPLART
jgi:hypothetical protein